MGKTMRTAEQVELDAKRQKLGEEAGTEAGDAATAADAADPGAPEAEDEYGYLDEELAINEDDIAAQAEAEQAIAALEVLQRQLMEVNDEASDKVLQIEVEYNQKRQPIYKERSEHLKKLPDFWQLCILQHPVLRSLVTEEDEEALRYIEDVVVEDAPDIKSGYSLQFRFAQNPFFSNAVLEKRCTFYDDGTAEITGTQPDWFPGKALTEDAATAEEELEPGRKRRRVRDSFFLWFEEHKPRGDALDADDPVADIFKEQIWVNPLKWYMEQPEDEDIEHEDEDDDEEGPEGDGRAGGAGNPIVLEDDDLEAYDDYEEGGTPGDPTHAEGAAGGEEEQLEDYYEEGGDGGADEKAELEEYEGEEGGEGVGEGAHGEAAADEAAAVAGAV